MPQHVLNMLDGLLENGSDKDIKTLGEGVKATLEIVSDTQADVSEAMEVIRDHIKNKDCHTPKGILVRTKVIAWCVFLMFLISTITMYIPEGIALIKGLP